MRHGYPAGPTAFTAADEQGPELRELVPMLGYKGMNARAGNGPCS